MLKTESHASRHPTGKLLFLAVAFGMGLIYASLIPLQYEPLSWNETLERFRDLRWLNLNIYNRADWVANGLAVIPLGFLLAGAADRNRNISFRYLLQIFAIISCGILLVVGIEFVQLWYPPRTVSGNDIAAGCVGAIIGPLLWPLLGRPYLKQWKQLIDLPKRELLSPKNARRLLFIYSALLIAYSIMPLDIIFSTEEWQLKYQQGRFAWLPGTDVNASNNFAGWLEFSAVLVLSSIRLILFGVLAYHAKLTKTAPILLISFPAILELLQAPIFTRYTTFIDILCGWTGALVGIAIAANWTCVTRLNQSKFFRTMLVLICVFVIELAFTGRYERFCTASEIDTKWKFFWAPPFSKYYYTTEFLAASNFAGKALAFGVLGFLIGNLRYDQRTNVVKTTLYGGLILLVAVCVELPQIYLQPFVADASDIFIYITGATIGWLAHDFVAGRELRNTEIQPVGSKNSAEH
ncbi:VanZ family protein [bacterium]|nr:VanZ family protein [bacterium]